MRLQGKIERWDDDKGFGFIAWHGDGSAVFVHITAFSGTTKRPVVGDIVSYEMGKNSNGKTRAEKVRFAGPSKPAKSSSVKRQASQLPLVFTSLFIVTIVVSALLNRISWLVVLLYGVASVVTFLAYSWDKSSAKRGAWRTAESTLHVMSLMGGWPGALAAQRLVRHKSSKREFLSIFWVTVLLNAAVAGYLIWVGDSGFVNQLLIEVWRGALAS